MTKLEIGFGGGHIDILLDLVSGNIEAYLGGGFSRYGEPDPNNFHARHGGKQYYQSRSGASGAGWVPARPTLKMVNGYRVDVSTPWIYLGGREGRSPLLVGDKEIWVPFRYRGSCIPNDWPVVVRDRSGQITFCTTFDLIQLLRGQMETQSREYRTKYLKDVNSPENEHVVTINEAKYNNRWANARRLVEYLHMEDIGFVFPEGWQPEGDEMFWKRLGFRRLPDGLYKVTRGVCRYMIEPPLSAAELQKYAPANVLVLAPHLYVQERDGRYVGVARFQIGGAWFDYEVYLEVERAFRILGGIAEDIRALERELEAGAHEKYLRALEDAQRHEEIARQELERDEKFRELLDQHAELELSIEDSLAAGNCRPGTDEFVRRFFPGRTTVKVKELSRFVTVWGVRRTLEHKLLPLAEKESPTS